MTKKEKILLIIVGFWLSTKFDEAAKWRGQSMAQSNMYSKLAEYVEESCIEMMKDIGEEGKPLDLIARVAGVEIR